MAAAISVAAAVGIMPFGLRMKRGSSNRWRSRPSAWLTAGWVRPSRLAAAGHMPFRKKRIENHEKIEVYSGKMNCFMSPISTLNWIEPDYACIVTTAT